MVKLFRFIENMDELYVHKKIKGKAVDILVPYVNDIILIRNDIGVLFQ